MIDLREAWREKTSDESDSFLVQPLSSLEALIATFFHFDGLNFFLQLHLVDWVKGSSDERSKAIYRQCKVVNPVQALSVWSNVLPTLVPNTSEWKTLINCCFSLTNGEATIWCLMVLSTSTPNQHLRREMWRKTSNRREKIFLWAESVLVELSKQLCLSRLSCVDFSPWKLFYNSFLFIWLMEI